MVFLLCPVCPTVNFTSSCFSKRLVRDHARVAGCFLCKISENCDFFETTEPEPYEDSCRVITEVFDSVPCLPESGANYNFAIGGSPGTRIGERCLLLSWADLSLTAARQCPVR